MITTGKIISNHLNENGTMIYCVELPIFKNAGVTSELNNIIFEATASTPGGIFSPYDIGDYVYVSFVDNNKATPVILGRIYKDLPKDKSDARAFEFLKTLEVLDKAVLPKDTTLGNRPLEDFEKALSVLENVNDIIEILRKPTKGKYLHCNSTTGKLEWVEGGGGGEPDQYIKNASVNGGTLTLIKKDDSTVTFTPVSFNPMKTSSTVEADDWTGEHFSTTTLQASQKILNDSTTSDGQCYLATVHWTDLPTSSSGQTITQIEVRAYVIKKSAGIVLFEANSADRAPYNWTYNSYSSGRVWISLGGGSVSTDNKSIDTNNSSQIQVANFDTATDKTYPVKRVDGQGNERTDWEEVIDTSTLEEAVAQAQAYASQASASASSAYTSEVNAQVSAQTASTINTATMNYVNNKFWWGTQAQYNALTTIYEGAIYFITVEGE